jgi:hypothetical protein
MLRVGRIFSPVLILLGFVQIALFNYNFTLLLAGLYIRRKNSQMAPELEIAFHKALEGKNSPTRSRTLPTKEMVIPGTAEIIYALDRLRGDRFILFIVDGDSRCMITEQMLIKHAFHRGLAGTMGDICYGKTGKSSETGLSVISP